LQSEKDALSFCRQLNKFYNTPSGLEVTALMGLFSSKEDSLIVLLCVPTLNGHNHLPDLLASIKQQTLQPDLFLAIDSGSDDGTVDTLREAGVTVQAICRDEFNHGGTRQLAVEMFPSADLVVYLTQDVILTDAGAMEKLIASFKDETVGAAYGRQLPRPGANPIEAHARLFNYLPENRVKSIADVPNLGIKTAFISNSFAAYRRDALLAVGGFPCNTIFGEDTCVAARLILAGWKVSYSADARVYHSHNYSVTEEFRRYFDIGVLHARESWLRDTLGKAEGEGLRFIRSELQFLLKRHPLLIPSALLRTVAKLFGYRLGLEERKITVKMKRYLSMNKGYWQ
jgi:rhamnosyltransferase